MLHTLFPSFLSNDPATTVIYTLSLHDALPICRSQGCRWVCEFGSTALPAPPEPVGISDKMPGPYPLPVLTIASGRQPRDRKSTRLNSSHVRISYAVFCLKKKKNITLQTD